MLYPKYRAHIWVVPSGGFPVWGEGAGHMVEEVLILSRCCPLIGGAEAGQKREGAIGAALKAGQEPERTGVVGL